MYPVFVTYMLLKAQKFKISKTKARSIVTGKDYVIKNTYFL